MTSLIIGPLELTHQVQSITQQELKAIQAQDATRSSFSFAVTSGEAYERAQINLLFTGLEEINEQLRRLIAIFRVCPICSVKNEQISTFWKIDVKSRYLEYIPIVIEELKINTVPDVPNALRVSLSITKVDASIISGQKYLEYKAEDGSGTRDPRSAFWLNKWIDSLLDLEKIPRVSEDDFKAVEIEWFGQDFLGEALEPERGYEIDTTGLDKIVINDANRTTKVAAISSSISNLFGFNKLIGKGTQYAQHMGCTSRTLSIEFLIDTSTPEGRKEFNRISNFKITSDLFIRSIERIDRIIGWFVRNPISKLLTFPKAISNSIRKDVGDGLFVPLQCLLSTTSTPNLKQATLEMVETSASVPEYQGSILAEGGTDYDNLKKYFDLIAEQEYRFRELLVDNPNQFTTFYSTDNADLLHAYQLFWPIESEVNYDKLGFNFSSTFGLLNLDTFRATLLSNFFDSQEGGSRLKLLIQGHWNATGMLRVAGSVPKLFQRFAYNASLLWDTVNGGIITDINPDSDQPNIYTQISQLIEDYLLTKVLDTSQLTPEQIDEVRKSAPLLTVGFFGDYAKFLDVSSNTGEFLARLAKTKVRFTPHFLDSLFNVLTTRAPQPKFIKNVYSLDGIQESFFKLIVAYKEALPFLETLQEVGRDAIYAEKTVYFRKSNFQDLPLPSYAELYGDQWEQYAPTYDDLGIVNPVESPSSVDLSEQELQSALAVIETDTVHPSAWFFSRRMKEEGSMRAKAEKSGEIATRVNRAMTLNLSYDWNEKEIIEENLNALNNQQQTEEEAVATRETLAGIIYKGLERSSRLNQDHRADMLALVKEFGPGSDPEESKGKTIILNISYSKGQISKRQMRYPGLGGELYRVAKNNYIINPTEVLPANDTDQAMKSSLDTDIEFVRHLEENTKKTIQSSISQIADDYNSPVKLFPACKVYLLDIRGKDIYADETFFDVNPIISIDISMDKDDADLAVIQIADPLHYLQTSKFSSGNSEETVIDGERKRVVLQDLNTEDPLAGFLERYKVAQGRAVMIKMGYDSMPKNLSTVFTGRISEIIPGDILTIVCQSWKSELISRQVSFYNDDPNAWGARDLAIQALVKAEPRGFGDYFSQRDTNFILRNTLDLDADTLKNRVEAITRSIALDDRGNRNLLDDALNWIGTSIGFGAIAKRNNGLDTRLKNIWYPDAPAASNILGLRSLIGVLPSYLNDSWIVPIQPSWEVFKEASRHAWNCVVQVLPFDGRATLFMGTPDQPYFFSNGNPYVMAKWKKRIRNISDKNSSILKKALERWKDSPYYSKNSDKIMDEFLKRTIEKINMQFVGYGNGTGALSAAYQNYGFYDTIQQSDILSSLSKFTDIEFLYPINNTEIIEPSYILIKKMLSSNTEILKKPSEISVNKSNLPIDTYSRVKNEIAGEATAAFFISSFYSIPIVEVSNIWPTYARDIEILLGNTSGLDDSQMNSILPISRTFDVSRSVGLQKKYVSDIKDFVLFATDLERANFESGFNEAKEYIKARIENDVPRLVNLDQEPAISELVYQLKYFSPQLINGVNVENYFDKWNRLIDLVAGAQLRTTSVDIDWEGVDVTDRVKQSLPLFKAYVYFFGQFILSDSETRTKAGELLGKVGKTLPPNMKVFRVHHWVDDDRDIIQNNIVASTKEMWNTVVVEHPAKGEISDVVDKDEQIYNTHKISSAVQWNYYPKNEVTGVFGLQFHPGLTLANKKIKVCTELNCYTPELAAKLACNHLAEGIRRMYRGSLLIRGRNIKPYDRISIKDSYTNMSGPIEVESVVHHWTPDKGWVCNIIPQAVAEANAGAGILQTAAMEAVLNLVFNGIEFISDVLMIATIVATLGSATAFALEGKAALEAASFSITTGLKRFLTSVKNDGVLTVAGKTLKAPIQTGGEIINLLASKSIPLGKKQSLTPLSRLGLLYHQFGGPAKAAGTVYTAETVANTLSHAVFKLPIIESFIENAQDVSKLPVLLSPLMFEGRPFVAGLESDSPVWSIFAHDLFYDARSLQAGAEKVLNSIYKEVGLPEDSLRTEGF